MPVLKAQMLYVHITGETTFVSLRFSRKKGFVDIAPLCCKLSTCYVCALRTKGYGHSVKYVALYFK